MWHRTIFIDYKIYKCRTELISKLLEECTQNITENEMTHNATLNDHRKLCNSFTICILLLIIFFIISLSISSAFIYLNWYLKKC